MRWRILTVKHSSFTKCDLPTDPPPTSPPKKWGNVFNQLCFHRPYVASLEPRYTHFLCLLSGSPLEDFTGQHKLDSLLTGHCLQSSLLSPQRKTLRPVFPSDPFDAGQSNGLMSLGHTVESIREILKLTRVIRFHGTNIYNIL